MTVKPSDIARRLVRDPIYWIQRHLHIEENSFLIFLAIIVGLLGGFGAIGFRLLIDGFQWLAIQKTGSEIIERVAEMPWWTVLLVPAAGGAVVGPLIWFLAREAKGHGVPEVMAAVATHGGIIRPRVVLVKSIASALTIGTGGSVGREGPIVQIGSAIGSTVGQILKLPTERLRVMVACGAAAGIAATFNAPFAGVVFAVEVILGSYAITTITPIIISSVIATIVCHAFPGITGGNVRAFVIAEPFKLVSVWEVPMYFVLGGLAALAALLFMESVHRAEDVARKIPVPEWLLAPVGGLALGGIHLASTHWLGGAHAWGVGYESIEQVLRGEAVWWILAVLVLLKIFATSLTIGSGGSGGIFAPSLFIGAMLGGAFGHWVHTLFPAVTAKPGAYALVGMGAVVAGATHAPLTAILILFEMTGDYAIILPLMIACVLASLVANRIRNDSIYTQKLTARGICISQGVETTVMESTRVSDVMRGSFPTVDARESTSEVLRLMLEENLVELYVVDHARRLRGIIDLKRLKELIREPGSTDLTAEDIASHDYEWVSPEDSMADCMAKFGNTELEELPVIEVSSRDEEGRRPQGAVLGIVTHRDIFMIYNREVLRQASGDLRYFYRQERQERSDYVEMPQAHRVEAIPVTPGLAGKTLRDLDLRREYQINVVAIRSRRAGARVPDKDVPNPEQTLKRSDTLIVVGASEDIERFKRSVA